ncbi:ATP-binding protein [Actinocatenispora rupis]|uniref:Anti-sigma regulatory factor n=1 Tax=Actinocatenispora rupis TaxID=519421 RepID=A0A8J3NE90_9ACTN|nr:ATP-binding protein [Actinocatenispora rupis]GID13685.1 anti-sigma regulatory factor [Actinocatenispora rupis]
MPTVRLGFSPAPAHVRTARLVAVAVARRAGVPEELLDEVRLAVGEACSRAVALHQLYHRKELVDVEMTDGPRFTVRVHDRGPAESRADALPDPVELVAHSEDIVTAEPFPAATVAVGMGLALLTGLVDDLEVTPSPDGTGTSVRMSWPIA